MGKATVKLSEYFQVIGTSVDIRTYVIYMSIWLEITPNVVNQLGTIDRLGIEYMIRIKNIKKNVFFLHQCVKK